MSEQSPGSEDLDAKPVRRTFTPEFKARILAEYDAAPDAATRERSCVGNGCTGHTSSITCGLNPLNLAIIDADSSHDSNTRHAPASRPDTGRLSRAARPPLQAQGRCRVVAQAPGGPWP